MDFENWMNLILTIAVIYFIKKQDIMMSRFTFLLVKKQKEIQIFDKNSFRIFTTVVL